MSNSVLYFPLLSVVGFRAWYGGQTKPVCSVHSGRWASEQYRVVLPPHRLVILIRSEVFEEQRLNQEIEKDAHVSILQLML